ncbi:MAG: SEC-C domain-containing protein [Planctomycetes bacterium]|nr:SEC-C domain-containing protein [Planctomycetota bacterium]
MMRRFCDLFREDPDATPVYKFLADGGSVPRAVVDTHCDNPRCGGCEVHIRLTAGESTHRALDFSVDLAAAQLSSPADWSAEELALAKELFVDPRTRAAIDLRHQAVRAWGLARLNARRRPAANRLYAFEEFSPIHETFAIHFSHEKRKWVVIEQYCVNPSCDCEDVNLSFFLNEPNKGSPDAEFTAALDLGTAGVGLPKEARNSPPESLLEAFKASLGDWKFQLSRRRGLIREAGRRRLIFETEIQARSKPACRIDLREITVQRGVEAEALPAASQAPPGRNDSCPCGSGRKFKRCCGR